MQVTDFHPKTCAFLIRGFRSMSDGTRRPINDSDLGWLTARSLRQGSLVLQRVAADPWGHPDLKFLLEFLRDWYLPVILTNLTQGSGWP